MKKSILICLFALMATFNSQASYYLVGDVFGGWDPGAGIEMAESEDGTYHYTFTLNGSAWFVFADSLDSDWSSFNAHHHYGPTDEDEYLTGDTWYTTQRSSSNGAYCITGYDCEYEIVLNPTTCQFIIYTEMSPFPAFYTVAGCPAAVFGTEWDAENTDNDMVKQGRLYHWTREDLELTPCLIEFKVVQNHDWYQSWPNMNYEAAIEEDGIYTIDIAFDPMAANNDKITCSITKTGEINPPTVLGDLNGDGKVNVVDVTLLINAVLGSDTDSRFDLNADGKINVTDVVILINICLAA